MGRPYVGTREHARMVAYSSDHLYNNYEWEYLAGGCMREAYLHRPTNVVYKREYSSYRGYGNTTEAMQARRLRKENLNYVRIPATSLYRFGNDKVIAMEYVEGVIGRKASRLISSEARQELYEKVRLEDMHSENFILELSTGKLVPIDMASPRGSIAKSDRRVFD